MADNVTFQTAVVATPPDATIVASDDVGGAQFQRVKLDIGGDGASSPITTANPLPISDAGGSLTVDGPLTDTQLRATAVDVADGGGSLSVDDGGGSLTVDGTVTASISGAVDITPAVPAANDYLPVRLTDGSSFDPAIPVTDNGSTLSVDDGGSSLTVDGSVTVTQATGTNLHTVLDSGTLSTITNVVHVDDNAGSLTVDNNGTFAVQATLSAGAAVIGHVITDSGSTTAVTGNVTVVQGTGTNLHAVLDSGSTTAVTQATGTNLHTVVDSGTISTITNVVHVDDNSGALTVDNGGTFAVQDSEKIADNGGFTDGTSKVQPAGYIFDEVAGTALTENDAAAARVDSKRAQVLVIEDETTRGRRVTVTAANALKVDASGVAVPITDNAGSLTVDQPTGTNLHTVVDSGTITTVSTVTAVTDAQVQGKAASGATKSGNPVQGGSVFNTTQPTVTNGQAVENQATARGAQIVATGVDAFSVTLAAGTALAGQVSASNETNTVYNGTTALTPKFAKISASSSGDNTIVSLVSSKKIRVLRWSLMSSGTVNVKWQSGAAGTDLTGLYYLIANTGISEAFCPVGHFESASGVLLNLNLSAGVTVGGSITYVEV